MRKKELTNQEKEDVMKLIDKGIAKSKISKMLHIDYRMLKRFFDENDIKNKKMGIQLKDYEPIFDLYLSGLTLIGAYVLDQTFPLSKSLINKNKP